MMISHRFGSADTLDRARYWLTQHGFAVAHPAAEGHDVSRLSLNVDLSQVSAAMALIDSIERSDPEGWPGILDRTRAFPAPAKTGPEGTGHAPAGTPIHWEPREPHPATDPLCCKVCEYMFGRWE